MLLLLSFLSISFVFAAFLTHGIATENGLLGYYLGLWGFVTAHIGLTFIDFCIALGIFFFVIRFEKSYTFFQKFFLTIFQFSAAIFVSSCIGLAILLVLAFVQLNALAIIIDNNPNLAGVVTDRDTIVNFLKKDPNPPTIIATENSEEREVVGVAQNQTGTNHIYGEDILPTIPNLLILPIERPLSSMILSDNTLIITKLDAKDLQAVGPTLGSLYIKHYFSDRIIKTSPKISVMNKSEYLKYRIDSANQKAKQLDTEISLVEDNISSLSAGITHDTDQVAYYQNLASESAKNVDDTYRKCINAGEYKNGIYVHYYSQTYCQAQQDNFGSSSGSYDKDITDWTALLSYDQSQLAAYKDYVTFFKTQKALVQIGKASLPDELGVFESPATIRLSFQTTNAHAIADVVETLIHEYLHFASFVPGKRFTSTFFEEGLTEYFARKATEDSLNIDTNLGYPVEVKIIAAMTNRIDESELETIYFSKDEDQLEKMLNRVYGDDFYNKNISTFQALMYTGDSDTQLQFANRIMRQIGGNPLHASDLESTKSNL